MLAAASGNGTGVFVLWDGFQRAWANLPLDGGLRGFGRRLKVEIVDYH